MRRYALLLGTATCHADPSLRPLPSVRQDVQQLKAVLEQAGDFDDVTVHLDLPAQVFTHHVEEFYGARRPGDLALFYYSGHGVRHDDQQSIFLATVDTVTGQPHATAFDVDGQLRHLLNHTKATQKVVLLDCCYSGRFTARGGLGAGMRVEPRRGKREYGTFVLTASNHVSATKAQGPDKPSVFTEVLLDGLRGAATTDVDGWVTTSDLSRFAMTEMARRRQQTPVESSEGVTEAARLVTVGESPAAADAAAGAPASVDDDAPFDTDQWRRLLTYYMKCMHRSAVLQSLVDPKVTGSYAAFPAGREQVFSRTVAGSVPLPDRLATLARQARSDGKSLLYGYPVATVRVSPRTPPQLAPLLVSDVEVSPDGNLSATFPPRPNTALAELRGLSDMEVEQLGKSVETTFIPGDEAALAATVNVLMSAFGLAPVQAIDPTQLLGSASPSGLDRVQNVSLLYATDDAGGPQRQLLQDLDHMIKKVPDFSRTALASLVDRADARPDEPIVVVAPDRLNESQEAIIQAAMAQRLTVAQGPPGTGKSQLVTALLATATAAGQTVLIGSTGNQAVSSVSGKAAELVGPGLLVRTGNKEMRAAEPQLITGLLDAASGRRALPDEHTPFAELRIVDGEIGALRANLDELRILERDLADLAAERATQPTEPPLPSADDELATLMDLAVRAGRRSVLGWWARWRLRRRYRVTEPDAIADLAFRCDVEIRWRDCRHRLGLLPDAHKNWQRLTDLTAADRPLHSVALLRAQVARRIADSAQLLQKRVDDANSARPDRWAYFPELLIPLPGWAVTAMSAQVFKRIPGMFDLVIIDEAAQCTIPAILPMLFRAKRALIIGDPRQLEPVIPLSEHEDRQQQANAGLSRQWLADRQLTYTRHSTYHAFAQAAGGAHLLDEHYRCHPDIVALPNREVYQRRLTVLTDPRRLTAPAEHPMRWHHVDGAFEHGAEGSGTNRLEVAEVVTQVAELRQAYPAATIGVVTPLARQQRALKAALRGFGENDETLLCATIHRFQGSERDIMVISPVGAYGIRDRTRDWLVHQTNLWNVAITRAKSQLMVVGDRTWWSGQRGLLAAVAAGGDHHGRDADRPADAADRLHAALRRTGATVQRKVVVDGQVFDLAVMGANGTRRVVVDDPAGDADGRGLRKLLAQMDIAGDPAAVRRVPAWRCLAEPDLVAAELHAGLDR